MLGSAALAFLTLVGLRLDLNLATASLAYEIVIVLLCLAPRKNCVGERPACATRSWSSPTPIA